MQLRPNQRLHATGLSLWKIKAPCALELIVGQMTTDVTDRIIARATPQLDIHAEWQRHSSQATVSCSSIRSARTESVR